MSQGEEMRDERGKMRGEEQSGQGEEMKEERGERKEEHVKDEGAPQSARGLRFAPRRMKDEETREEGKKGPAAWEQMEGEPLSHYNRFLVYRDLGSTRTLRKAWALVKGKNWKTVGDTDCKYWRDLSARWKWVRRAQEWDRARLTEAGDEAIVQFVGGLKRAATEVNQAFERVKPKTWREAMEGLDLVGSFIDPQSIKAVAGHGEPGDSEEDEEED